MGNNAVGGDFRQRDFTDGPKLQLAPEVLAAIIGGVAGLVTSLVMVLLDRRRRTVEIDNLSAETAKLRLETEALLRKPIDEERQKYRDLLMNFLNPFLNFLTQNQLIYDALLEGRGALEYHPQSLARFFASLPYNDRRKLYWFSGPP